MVEGRERKGRQGERTEGVVMEGGRGGRGQEKPGVGDAKGEKGRGVGGVKRERERGGGGGGGVVTPDRN